MKINITPHPEQISGYTNISPALGHDYSKMDQYEIFDAQCEEVLVNGMVDFLPIGEILPVFQHWVAKLRHGAKIKVVGTEADEVARMAFMNILSGQEFNQLVFGTQQDPWSCKRGLYTIQQVTEILASLGLQIVTKKIEKYTFVIEAKRP